MSDAGVIAAVTERARLTAKSLGPTAETAVENLRLELERSPRLGVLVRAQQHTEIYKTRIEGRGDMPGLAVAYVYTPQPPPQTVAIVSLVPDDTSTDS
ncbi:hypothetical protein ACGFYU_30810 [Streptomyces sp. NPDC048337]|uniref:hypothetical protein n=1 Tax=Streptomyces sp. NPDC048337 TaxID=3365535 RepID=UPI0037102209